MRSYNKNEILERYAELREEQERYDKIGIGSTSMQKKRINNIIQICLRRGYIQAGNQSPCFSKFIKAVIYN